MRRLTSICLVLVVLFSTFRLSAETKVVGYIPVYKDLVTIADNVSWDKVTHINLSFLNPDSTGQFRQAGHFSCMPKEQNGQPVQSADIRYVIEQAHQYKVKVLLSLGGGVLPACTGDWRRLLQPDSRDSIVTQLVALVDEFNLDGLDVDLEGVLLTHIDQDGNYTPFIRQLSDALVQQQKLLTSATASYEGGMIPISSIGYFDFVNIMSYDSIGPSWGKSGSEHATFAQSQKDIQLWKARGLTQQQLVLGVPFYGYGFGRFKANYSFRDLLTEFGQQVINQDVIGQACAQCDYITFNSLATIQAKTRLALEQGSGVMIWELSHDAQGEYSLLNGIQQQLIPQTSNTSERLISTATESTTF
ncbi:glycosyl hydrolase family 18 protein [Neptunicella sp. SCSIO 80796]|uniref:glycosyl hydrolase family 18 protein n=1 Tax=Neptunicella plasticusilytica TaxID=3117012 RepID=UPI003A4D9EFD